ncbi:MAG: DUF4388 domain-containing protein [Desulfobulbaceae bacterium]|nr:DUF4388 domain-containing protein [Desulfobulbaceae bacterium]
MNLQGDFEGSFLTSILQLLCDDQNTGVLQVTCGSKGCSVFLRKGAIVYVQSSRKEARLGSILKRDKVISDDQLQKALAVARQKNIALGKALVEQEYVSLDVLFEYNKKQAEEILYSSLFWEKGKFKYKDASLNLDGMLITRLNPMKLVLEASRRIDEMSILTKLITTDQLVYKKIGKKTKNRQDFDFSPSEEYVFSLINGTRTVRQIIDKSLYEEFSVYKSLYGLISSGLIEQKQQKKEENSAFDLGFILSIYTNAIRVITRILAEKSGIKAAHHVEEAKKSLPQAQAEIVANFKANSSATINKKAILTAYKKNNTNKARQNLLLIDGLNGLCHYLLSKTTPLVEQHLMYEIIQEIDQVIDYVREYQKDSIEKDKIISDMKNVLDDTIKQVQSAAAGKNKKGLFSFLRK